MLAALRSRRENAPVVQSRRSRRTRRPEPVARVIQVVCKNTGVIRELEVPRRLAATAPPRYQMTVMPAVTPPEYEPDPEVAEFIREVAPQVADFDRPESYWEGVVDVDLQGWQTSLLTTKPQAEAKNSTKQGAIEGRPRGPKGYSQEKPADRTSVYWPRPTL